MYRPDPDSHPEPVGGTHPPDGLVVFGPGGELLEMNAEALRIHGFDSLEEARRARGAVPGLFELRALDGARLAPEDGPGARALRGERVEALELQVCRRDTGACRIVVCSALPVVRGGEVVCAVLSLRDAALGSGPTAAEARRALWFRTLFNAVKDAVFVYPLGPDGEPGRFVEVNAVASERLGYSYEEFLSMRVHDVVASDVSVPRTLDRLKARGSAVVESVHRTKDGRRIPVEVHAVRFEHEGGIAVLSVCRDLREREAAAEAVRERRAAFLTLANSIPQLAWMAHPDGSIFWYNDRWYAYTGTTLSEMEGWGWRRVHHPDHVEAVTEGFRRAIREGAPWEDTFPLRGADGGYRWFLSRALPLRGADGTIVQWFGTNTDITARLEMERALRESEARYRSLMESVPQMMWVLRPDGSVEYFNRRWTEYTGRPAEQPGPDWIDVIHPDDRVRLRSVRERAIGEGRPYEVELRMRRADGVYRWHLGRVGPMFRDGTLFAWLGTATDIDERRRAEESLRALNQTLEARVERRTNALLRSSRDLTRSNLALQQRNRELQDFAYVASHDLQEPLRKIRTFADLLRGEYDARFDEQGRYFLDRVEDGASRAARLIQDLLAFSRVVTHASSFQHVDVGELVAEVARDLDLLLEEADAVLTVECSTRVEGDRSQLRQLVQHLVQNALKFRREDEPARVRVRCAGEEETHDGPMVRLEIEDNGIGFDEKYLDRIFSPFQRLHGRGVYPGTGMGLSICRRIVERHGGTITARSAPGAGTTFVVRLPLRQERPETSDGEGAGDDVPGSIRAADGETPPGPTV